MASEYTKEVTSSVTISAGLEGKELVLYLSPEESENPGAVRATIRGQDSAGNSFGHNDYILELGLTPAQADTYKQLTLQVVEALLAKHVAAK